MSVVPAVDLGEAEFHTHRASDTFAALRRDDPVHWVEPLQTWILTKYEDVRWASCESKIFSVTAGIRLDDAKYGVSTSEGFFGDGGEFLAFTDPPRHTELRRVLAPMFTPRAVRSRVERIKNAAKEIVDQVVPGDAVDWVRVVERLPILVGLDILGLPSEDAGNVRNWSDAMERLSYSLTPEELVEVHAAFAPLAEYLAGHVQIRQGQELPEEPDDLISILLHAQQHGVAPLSDANIIMFLQTVLGAGNDTMRSLLTGMVLVFAQHPAQWTLLRENRELADAAIEELLRWITPARGFIRTVIDGANLRDKALEPGQHVYLAYDSANRDEEVFVNPDVFDIREDRRPQASFGFGTHNCIGAAFARAEAAALLTALLDRFSAFEIAGDPVSMVSVLRNGWHSAPAIFHT